MKKLYDTLTSYIPLHLMYAMAKLELADLLRSSPLHINDLSAKAHLSAVTLRRICRGLVLLELLSEENDIFTLTPLGHQLCTDYPGSVHNLAILAVEQFSPAWSKLADAARSDTTGFELAFGKNLFAYNEVNIHAANPFHGFMADISADLASILLQVYDFSGVKSVLDVGGGTGTCIKSILEKYPSCHGALLEDPEVTLLALENCADLVTNKRLSILAGNFMDSVPGGYEVYILSQILHDWNDDACSRILRHCREAMDPASRLLIITCLMPERNEKSDFAVISDLNMMVLTGGKERTRTEYNVLLQSAGLEIIEMIPARMEYHIIVAGTANGMIVK